MVQQKYKLQKRQIILPVNKREFRALTNSRKAKTSSYEIGLISKSSDTLIFLKFYFGTKYFIIFRKVADQGQHTVQFTVCLIFPLPPMATFKIFSLPNILIQVSYMVCNLRTNLFPRKLSNIYRHEILQTHLCEHLFKREIERLLPKIRK